MELQDTNFTPETVQVGAHLSKEKKGCLGKRDHELNQHSPLLLFPEL